MSAAGTLVEPGTETQSLRVVPKTEPSASDLLQDAVEQCLRRHSYANAFRNVSVEIKDGSIVVLVGTVATFFFKSIAQEAIKGFVGVDGVTNCLQGTRNNLEAGRLTG